jgi:hypothetical protein
MDTPEFFLRDFYKQLSIANRISLRDMICDSCGFSIITFYHKLRGGRGFRKLESERILQIIEQFKEKAIGESGEKILE